MDAGADSLDEILALYEGLREEILGRGVDAAERDGDAEKNPLPVLARFRIGTDDFPEEAISSSDVSFLLSTLTKVDRILRSPLPEAADWASACLAMTRRYTLGLANVYLVWTAFFLACDKRFNPGSPVALDAASAFDVGANDFSLRLECLAKVTAFICPLLGESFPCAFLAGELRILQLAAAAFFDMLESVFGLPSVGKCRIGFDRLMQAFGTQDAVGLVSNCLRRHRTMFREVRAADGATGAARDRMAGTAFRELQEQNAAIEKTLEEVRTAVTRNTRVVEKMDGRQRELAKSLKTMLGGFVRLFRPGQPPPTREKAAAALLPSGRYACLERVKEPHRSQIKSVIDYTWNGHPVSFGDKRRSAYTLSDAVADVWRANESKWAKVQGTFATERDLHSACYNIAEKAEGGVSFNFRK